MPRSRFIASFRLTCLKNRPWSGGAVHKRWRYLPGEQSLKILDRITLPPTVLKWRVVHRVAGATPKQRVMIAESSLPSTGRGQALNLIVLSVERSFMACRQQIPQSIY